MLKQRLITAAILITAMLGVLFYAPMQLFFWLTFFVSLMGAWEWANLIGLTKLSHRLLYVAASALVLFSLLFVSIIIILFTSFIWWVCAAVLVLSYPRLSGYLKQSRWCRAIMGWLVLAPSWIALNFIRTANEGDGTYALLFLFILIWGADSLAYFVGRVWGKHKLLPLVSPGKSWEGLVSALIGAMVIAFAVLELCHIPAHVWPWAIGLSSLTVLFSVIGDLFESLLKRLVGIKDSGRLLPGHGGLLDRIDSLTAAAPIFALGAMLLGIYLD